MRTSQHGFIDTFIDPIPFFGPLIADVFHTWSGVADAMNMRNLVAPTRPTPPADNLVVLQASPPADAVRRAA